MPESPNSPAAVVTAMTEAVLRGDVEAALSLIAPEAVDHAPLPGAPTGHAGWTEKWRWLAENSHGVQTALDQRVAEGDTVASRYKMTSPDGQTLGYALDMLRVQDGKIVEHWASPAPG